MSGETEQAVSGWTVDTLKYLHAVERAADKELAAERDRRYAEVAQEREKALKIKETADETARILAREIQDYKDEKANQLREQIGSERGLYATKDDVSAVAREVRAEMKPVLDFVAGQVGRSGGLTDSRAYLVWALGLVVAALTIYSLVHH